MKSITLQVIVSDDLEKALERKLLAIQNVNVTFDMSNGMSQISLNGYLLDNQDPAASRRAEAIIAGRWLEL